MFGAAMSWGMRYSYAVMVVRKVAIGLEEDSGLT